MAEHLPAMNLLLDKERLSDDGDEQMSSDVNGDYDEFEDQDEGRTLVGTNNTSLLINLVSQWGSEKQYFVYGIFPNVSVSGKTIGHYTQMVWGDSQQVGCGIANNDGGWVYFVCNYYLVENMRGRLVY